MEGLVEHLGHGIALPESEEADGEAGDDADANPPKKPKAAKGST